MRATGRGVTASGLLVLRRAALLARSAAACSAVPARTAPRATVGGRPSAAGRRPGSTSRWARARRSVSAPTTRPPRPGRGCCATRPCRAPAGRRGGVRSDRPGRAGRASCRRRWPPDPDVVTVWLAVNDALSPGAGRRLRGASSAAWSTPCGAAAGPRCWSATCRRWTGCRRTGPACPARQVSRGRLRAAAGAQPGPGAAHGGRVQRGDRPGRRAGGRRRRRPVPAAATWPA